MLTSKTFSSSEPILSSNVVSQTKNKYNDRSQSTNFLKNKIDSFQQNILSSLPLPRPIQNNQKSQPYLLQPIPTNVKNTKLYSYNEFIKNKQNLMEQPLFKSNNKRKLILSKKIKYLLF